MTLTQTDRAFLFVWLRHSRHLPLGYCIVSLYWFIKYKGQLVELHKLWGQFQANLNLGWCLSLCNSSRSVISLPGLLNVSSQRHWLDWLIVLQLHPACWSSTWFVISLVWLNPTIAYCCFDWPLLLCSVLIMNMARISIELWLFMIFCELLISLVLYVAALEMMDFTTALKRHIVSL